MKQRKRKFLTRVTAFVLAMVLICPTMSVLAADVSAGVVMDEREESEDQAIPDNTETTEVEKQEILEDTSEDGYEDLQENDLTEEIENISDTFTDENEGKVEEPYVTKETEDEIKQQMNWTYVESSYLETPGTQRIVVSWGEESVNVDSMTLKVQGSNGIQEEWAISNAVNNLYLFEKEFTDESQSGTYEATELTVKVGTSEKTFTMDEMGAEVLFGVNEEYAGVEELRSIEDEMNTDDVSASVAIINEDGTLKAEESIGDALAQATADVQASMPSTMSIQDESTDTRAGNIVVALDPGHDANDRGAAGNGLREEDLTLKIANYCKEELEEYNGVTVYMTRTGAACPYNKPGISCMADRVNAAYKAGAKIFVSFHLNSFNGKAYGAEVIVPNKNWKPNVGIEGTELGNAVLDELVKLGLTKRKVYSKDSTVNEYYPDGSKSDYFSVQIHCKEKGIPGIIVEHAFIDNANDANKYLKTEAGLKSLGVADATGIAKYLGLTKGKWVEDKNGWKYQLSNGVFAKKQLLTIDGKTYYFDANGYRVTGWQDISGKRYYFMPDGHMHTGWLSFGSTYYYMMPDGHMHTGWLSFGSTYYYMNQDGVRVTGWQTIDGKDYYFDSNGVRKDGYPIEGKSEVTISQMIKMYKKQNKMYPSQALAKGGAPTIEDFVNIVYQEAGVEGIKAEVVFCQSMLETGWLQFGGDVKVEQFNFAGLGATGGGVAGADFSSYGKDGVRMGIRAQVQHLKCYANKEALINPCVDPRWGEWLRGKAPYVEWLGIKENPYGTGWAAGADYGNNIVKLIKSTKAL